MRSESDSLHSFSETPTLFTPSLLLARRVLVTNNHHACGSLCLCAKFNVFSFTHHRLTHDILYSKLEMRGIAQHVARPVLTRLPN